MTTEPSPAPTAAQTPDDCFELLSDGRRRHVVAVLSKRETTVHLRDLAAAVVARENGTGAGDVSPDAVKDVGVRLHHVHLPKLADAGLVDYDAGTRIVRPVRAGEPVREKREQKAGGRDGRPQPE